MLIDLGSAEIRSLCCNEWFLIWLYCRNRDSMGVDIWDLTSGV